jgi:RNA polymerase sigma factor (sigma-70 family)
LLDLDDLKQEGRAAIMKAIREYSPGEDEHDFKSHVMMEIKWRTWESVWDDSLIPNNDSWARAVIRTVRKAERANEQLTLEEISERTGASIDFIRDVLTAADNPDSLDYPIGEKGVMERYDVVPATAARRPTEDAALAAIEARRRTEEVQQAVQELSDRYRHALELYMAGVQHADIAEELGSTVGAAQNVVYHAKKKLRERLAEWRNEEAISWKGIYLSGEKTWAAYFTYREGSKKIWRYLGVFKTAREAAQAYDRVALEYFGEQAVLNFPVSKNLESERKERALA